MGLHRWIVAALLGVVLAGCGSSAKTSTVQGQAASKARTAPPQGYREPSVAMEPTLTVGQRVLVRPIGMGGSPHVGEIAVFHPPEGAEEQRCGAPQPAGAVCDRPQGKEASATFIKRIVAGPGDMLFIKQGHVYLNGKLQHEPFTAPCGGVSGCNYPTRVTLPPGDWFMMGDNRGRSEDSRYWGPIPTSWIVGVAE